jgi:hypothetical protein
MLYLYAIGHLGSAEPLVTLGIGDAPANWLPHGQVAALVSIAGGADVPASAENVWRHEEVVEAAGAAGVVLPVRFGTLLRDEAALHSALAPCCEQLLADLERLRGRVELAVRALWDAQEGIDPASQACGADTAPKPATGREYLLARLKDVRKSEALRQRAEIAAQVIHAPLSQMAADCQKRILVTPRLLLTAAYLVDLDRLASFRTRVEELGAAHPELQLLCTGPWPAYSFVAAIATPMQAGDGILEGLGDSSGTTR